MDATRHRWELRLDREDDQDPSVTWSAEVDALFEPDRTSFVTRLRRESRDHRLRPLAGTAAPPLVIRDVLRSESVDCFDGPMRVEPQYRVVGEDEVAGFVDTMLLADDRRLPILAVAGTAATTQRLDVSVLSRKLVGVAHVVVVQRAALPVLGRALESLSVAAGSARLWWPGLLLDDAALVHPSWPGPFTEPVAVTQALIRQILAVSRDRWREPERFVRFARDLRHRREEVGRFAAQRVADELTRLRLEADAIDREAPIEHARLTDTQTRLEAMEHDIQAVAAELEKSRAEADNAEAAFVEADDARSRLEADKFALQGRIEGLLVQRREGGHRGDRAARRDKFRGGCEECLPDTARGAGS